MLKVLCSGCMRVATHCTCESHKLSRLINRCLRPSFVKSGAKVDKKKDFRGVGSP